MCLSCLLLTISLTCPCCLLVQIQAAVDSKRLEGLLSGKVQLPLSDRVELCTKPVSAGYSETNHSVSLLCKQLGVCTDPALCCTCL